MANEFELSPKELKRQADALLAAADAAEKAAEREPAARSAKKSTRKKGEETAQEAPAVMTDEEARKAGILRLDDKQVAALPAASWLMNNEKLRELLARGKKKGKLDSADLMDAVDDLNLESDQMDQLYDSLEALNIDISADDAGKFVSGDDRIAPCRMTSPPQRRSPMWRKRSWWIPTLW